MSGHVYFFHNGKECKIGFTTPDPKLRLWAAHVWSPHALTIVGTIAAEFPDQLEKAIHLQLAHRRLVKPSGNGEWFDLTLDETTKVILENKNGYFLFICKSDSKKDNVKNPGDNTCNSD